MARVSREALIDTTIETIKIIEEGFTEPDDDWNPIAQIAADEEITTVGLDADKSHWGLILANLCESLEANAVVAVLSAYSLEIEPTDPQFQEKIDLAERIGVMNMDEHSESLIIMGIDSTGEIIKSARINRHEDKPPTLGEFKPWSPGGVDNILQPVLDYFEIERR